MGQFVHIGLVSSINVYLDQKRKDLALNNLCKIIEEETGIDTNQYIYNKKESEIGHIVFHLKDSWFGDNLVTFIKQQMDLSSLFNLSEEASNTLKSLSDFKTFENYFEDNFLDYIQIVKFSRYFTTFEDLSISINLNIISLAKDGKIMFEGGDEIFNYVEKNIRLQNHPLAKCIKMGIIG